MTHELDAASYLFWRDRDMFEDEKKMRAAQDEAGNQSAGCDRNTLSGPPRVAAEARATEGKLGYELNRLSMFNLKLHSIPNAAEILDIIQEAVNLGLLRWNR